MDSIGEFHEVERNGKVFLEYHHPKYLPISQTQSPTSSGEAAQSHHLPCQPLFLCPYSRYFKDYSGSLNLRVTSSPEYIVSTEREETSEEEEITEEEEETSEEEEITEEEEETSKEEETKEEEYHSVLPLFWCNNKDFDLSSGCFICGGSNFGTDYFLCVYHDYIFHKECVQSPTKINHPYHPERSLQLSFSKELCSNCLCCGREAGGLVYKCTICDVAMHPTCAMKSVFFIEDQPKIHDHPLTFFSKQASLTCNVCGLLRKSNPTYVCLRCSFVAHDDCMYSPRIIKISRHHHRISYTSSLLSSELSCGVCRKSIDSHYGSYTCYKCGDYAVHSKCALRVDVWDGLELEGVLEKEEDDITLDAGPFEMISEGVILHFLHDHHLRFEVSLLYDENKLCQACVLPIYEGNLYSCVKCEFIIHETCAQNRRRIQHALHPHPLSLNAKSLYNYGAFGCNACSRHPCNGFVYACPKKECDFDLDVRCASMSEPIAYQGHKHHQLFLALGPDENPICVVCKSESHIPLNCMECDFLVCMKCATLPYEARYKCDKHVLKISFGKEVCEKDWCEVCERNLGDTNTKLFYWCNECSTTVHIECLLGKDPYMKPGQILVNDKWEFQILGKSAVSRPICYHCKEHCQGIVYKYGNLIACSCKCSLRFFR